MLPLWGRGTLQEGVPKVGISDSGEASVFSGQQGGFKLQRGNSRGLSQPLIANIQGLKELKEGGEVDMEVSPSTWNIEEKDQQDNLLGINRELGNPPDSSSPEGRVKFEGASQGYESSSEESVEAENNRENRDTDESIEEDEKGVEDNIGIVIRMRKKREQ